MRAPIEVATGVRRCELRHARCEMKSTWYAGRSRVLSVFRDFAYRPLPVSLDMLDGQGARDGHSETRSDWKHDRCCERAGRATNRSQPDVSLWHSRGDEQFPRLPVRTAVWDAARRCPLRRRREL